MAIYEYRCESCNFVLEVIQAMKTATFEDRVCPRCSGAAKHIIGAPAVATSGMSQAPMDVVIGRDAEARWADIRNRQAIRNKVRQESGAAHLTMTGRNSFEATQGTKLVPVVLGPDNPKESGPKSAGTKGIIADLDKQ